MDYTEKSVKSPNYRLGQHFINLFIEDESDPIFNGLWQADQKEAFIIILDVMKAYQWDYDNMPLKSKGECE